MFDENLVDAIVGGKDLDCGSAQLRVNLGLTHGHGSLLLGVTDDVDYFRMANGPEHYSPAIQPLYFRILSDFDCWNEKTRVGIISKVAHYRLSS